MLLGLYQKYVPVNKYLGKRNLGDSCSNDYDFVYKYRWRFSMFSYSLKVKNSC